jgi:hypothetical protein
MDCEVRKLRRISRTPIKSNKKAGVKFEETTKILLQKKEDSKFYKYSTKHFTTTP